MSLLDSPLAASDGDVALARGERDDHDRGGQARCPGPFAGAGQASSPARRGAAAARRSPARRNAWAASVAASAAEERDAELLEPIGRCPRPAASPAAAAAAWAAYARTRSPSHSPARLAQAIGHRRRLAEPGHVVEEPGLGAAVAGRRGRSAAVRSTCRAPGEVARGRRAPTPAPAPARAGRRGTAAAGRARPPRPGPRRRRPRQACAVGQGGQHEPARARRCRAPRTGRRASPSQRRAVSTRPASSAHRPSWWPSHMSASGGAVAGVASYAAAASASGSASRPHSARA